MQVNTYHDPMHMGEVYNCFVGREDFAIMGQAIQERVIEMVASQMAKDILENNYNEILENISPVAIANMTIAEAGAAINETLHKKMPDKIRDVETIRTQVYQRGVFGGLKRIS